MRVTAGSTLIDLDPGSSAAVDLDVINTGPVIDGITARVIGLPSRQVSTTPPVLALFPEATGRLTVNLGVPAAFPAGRHPVTVEIHSRQDGIGPEYLDLDLLVPTRAEHILSVRPKVVRAHRKARFVVTVTNTGNVRLEVALVATDPEKVITPQLTPQRMALEAGRSCDVLVEVRGPRMILGSEIDRPVTVTATATAESAPTDPAVDLTALEPAQEPGVDPTDSDRPAQTVVLMLRQRPWLTRGMLTALILLAIIALWAAVFLFGLRQVFAADPPTKTAADSFFVASDIAPAAYTGQAPGSATGSAAGQVTGAATGDVTGATTSAATGPAPLGALPKDGSMPSGLGGVIAGTVTATSSSEPVGRILVDALRPTATGGLDLASSSATQADGSYQIAGLFPGGYLLKFTAIGFDPIWYPAAPDQGGAIQVTAASAVVTPNINVVINGQPASITGSVDRGDTLQPVVTTITARATQGAAAGQDVATTTTDGNNAYTLPNLPAPAVYELSFAADGYQPSVVQTKVDGGSQRIQPTVLLTAGPGQISGVVTDGSTPLGGITVTTTVGGKPVTTGTPTTGEVGRFVLGNLPTPATYVLTVSGAGFGGTTVVVDLGPGQNRDDLAVSLSSGTGQLSGVLVGSDGVGIGGATVTVGGMTNPPTTNTLTAGTVGAFSFSGLPAGASLTLTFDKSGFSPTTVPVQLGATNAPLTVTMPDALGRITGTVTDPGGAPISGATVTATDGKRSWPVTSSSATPGSAAGSYVIAGLPTGAYTVTATNPFNLARTALVTVTAGGQVAADFVLPPDPAVVGGG